ncbi:hypothetical protein CTAYLR_004434 [Chrysophaeum taylorii]|uniref:Uncharacterized protein n=1 Tax=Chrysophaeum taylorii TaxID=2483200 RepID=A0AAD7UCV0_9STRA|nr:hypothetical protein CTAYLR_004434 [Chrysophaeum taylorii]
MASLLLSSSPAKKRVKKENVHPNADVIMTDVVDPARVARAALDAAIAKGEVIDVDAAPICYNDSEDVFASKKEETFVAAARVKAEELAKRKIESLGRATAEAAYESRVWGEAGAERRLTETLEVSLAVPASAAERLGVGVRVEDTSGLEPYCKTLRILRDAARSSGLVRVSATATAIEDAGVAKKEKDDDDDNTDDDEEECVRVKLNLEPRVTEKGLTSGQWHMGGHAGLQEAVAALLSTLDRVVAREQKSKGLAVPPRAARTPHTQLRTPVGLLNALETEGVRDEPPGVVPGLAEAVVLGEYQRETVAWMLAREKGAFGLEDLFVSALPGGIDAVSLPCPRFRSWPRKKGCCKKEMRAQREVADVLTTFAARGQFDDVHRGGILASDMGLGKTMCMICLCLCHPCPPPTSSEEHESSGATLVVVPDALIGQWRAELASRAPGVPVSEWGEFRKQQRGGFVLCTYKDVDDEAMRSIRWWRVVLDEPHASLWAKPRSGRVDLSPTVAACADLESTNRWCITGTPWTNQIFEVYGQLCFLKLVPRLLSRDYVRCVLANNHQSEYNSTAECLATILKPLLVRHSKSSERDGKALVSLPPLRPETSVLISVPDHLLEDDYERLLRDASRRVDAVWTRKKFYPALHFLRPLELLCAGDDLEASLAYDSVGAVSNVDSLPSVRLPSRLDAEAKAENVSTNDMDAWARSLRDGLFDRGAEHCCVCCLQPCINSLAPRASSTCSHLVCGRCVEDTFEACESTSDRPEGVDYAVEVRKPDDIVRRRPFLVVSTSHHSASSIFPPATTTDASARRAIHEALKRAFAPFAHHQTMDIRVKCAHDTSPVVTVRLCTESAEDEAAKSLDGCPATELFRGVSGVPKEAYARVARKTVTVAAPPCPGCGVRMAAEDILDLRDEVVDAQNDWRAKGPRDFVVAHVRRARALSSSGGGGGGEFFETTRMMRSPDTSIAEAKVRKVEELVRGAIDAGERCVVFCKRPVSVNLVAKALQAGGILVASFTAFSDRRNRERAVASLQGGAISVLVTTLVAGGIGLNMTAASTVLFFEPNLNTAVFKQAVGRCHRIGQVKPVSVFVLAVEGTHEEKSLDLANATLPPKDLGRGMVEHDQVRLRTAALVDRLAVRSS